MSGILLSLIISYHKNVVCFGSWILISGPNNVPNLSLEKIPIPCTMLVVTYLLFERLARVYGKVRNYCCFERIIVLRKNIGSFVHIPWSKS